MKPSFLGSIHCHTCTFTFCHPSTSEIPSNKNHSTFIRHLSRQTRPRPNGTSCNLFNQPATTRGRQSEREKELNNACSSILNSSFQRWSDALVTRSWMRQQLHCIDPGLSVNLLQLNTCTDDGREWFAGRISVWRSAGIHFSISAFGLLFLPPPPTRQTTETKLYPELHALIRAVLRAVLPALRGGHAAEVAVWT